MDATCECGHALKFHGEFGCEIYIDGGVDHRRPCKCDRPPVRVTDDLIAGLRADLEELRAEVAEMRAAP